MLRSLLSGAFALFLPGSICPAADVPVSDAARLRVAVKEAKPGTRILLAPGQYGGGFWFSEVRGEPGKPIVIAAADPSKPPVFSGGALGMHFSKPAYLELHNLVFTKHSGNGVNLDNGSDPAGELAKGLVLRGLTITDIGARGNEDGIKLSGVADFLVAGCTVERWGTGGGSAIDMVGCHRGVVEGSAFRHGEAPGATGVQCKGGTSAIAIRRNVFDNAGGRALNIGGSTGLQYFRPPLQAGGRHAEARDIRVEGNRFTGSLAPIAFVGVDGAAVRFNTFERPGKWIIRILQENREPGFVPCQNGEFTDNVVVFEAAHWAEGGVNLGPGTAPETFKFARNWWYCTDRPDRSHPNLPVKETDGAYGKEPRARMPKPARMPTRRTRSPESRRVFSRSGGAVCQYRAGADQADRAQGQSHEARGLKLT